MADSQSRVKRGVPSGGQFGNKTTPEADVGFLSPRRRWLATQSEAVGASASPLSDPGSSAFRAEWWDQSFQVAEYRQAGDVPQMPDDETPNMTHGKALSGARRTHRMCYRGGGVRLRMPSVTAVRRFSESGVSTFDVPVSAERPGGKVSGWVRVTRGDDGSWAARGVGFSGRNEAYVAESVQAVLEARRPSRALAESGDLLERHKQRLAAEGAERQEVRSSFIENVAYSGESGTLAVRIRGKDYGYRCPSGDAFKRLLRSDSPGRTYNELVKNRMGREQVSACGRCGKMTAASVGHRCRPAEASRPSSHNDRQRQAAVFGTALARGN